MLTSVIPSFTFVFSEVVNLVSKATPAMVGLSIFLSIQVLKTNVNVLCKAFYSLTVDIDRKSYLN